MTVGTLATAATEPEPIFWATVAATTHAAATEHLRRHLRVVVCHCGATAEEPCRTRAGKVTRSHRGRA